MAADAMSLKEPDVMGESSVQSPSNQQLGSNLALSPHPQRTGTPVRQLASMEGGNRAASAHPETALPMPMDAQINGAPTRQYINAKVTGVLLEGMKIIAKEQPRDPLRVLGEYLLQRSRELEGGSLS